MSLLEAAPADTLTRLQELKGADLLVFFNSLHWNKCLTVLLLKAPDDLLKSVLEAFIEAVPDKDQDQFLFATQRRS